MEIEIGIVAEEKAKHIAEIMIKKYSTDLTKKHKSFLMGFWDGILDGLGLSHYKIQKEIYVRSFHETTAFFLNHGDAKFDDKIIHYLQERLRARLENPKVVKKMNPEEMLAYLIKIEVIDILLLEHDIVI
jgi:hypothetical protein